MKTSQILSAFLLFLLPFFSISGVKAQDYTGTYQVETGGLTFTLSIQQDTNNILTGSLIQSNGSVFNLQGMVAEGVPLPETERFLTMKLLKPGGLNKLSD
jgi:hypothetical protein